MQSRSEEPLYQNPSRSPAERAADLVARMTLQEKVSQMVNAAPAIPRLGVPEYNWWNECLHGVGRAGIATVFPQAIGLAAAWNTDLMHRIGVAISDEARAKHHEAFERTGRSDWYYGLTFWSPNINIFRDPRWGRGQETYGEDPCLTGRLGVAFIRALQGDHPRYLKLVATPKHYAVHSGPEALRHGFDARVGLRDLWETYLPAFRMCIQEGRAASLMPAYNRTNGEACAASPTLLEEILRRKWGFEGYVVSDCGAIDDIYRHHRLANSPAEAAALAVRHGCDLNCGDTYLALTEAVQQGMITEAEIDRSVRRLFEARFRLGMFDPKEQVPYAQIPISVNDCEAHRELARQAARESIVLLKNENRLLPFGESIRSLAVIGPNADDVEALLGNYNGTPSHAVTHLEGIRRRAEAAGVTVRYARGCDLTDPSREGFAEALEAARLSDAVVMVMGISPRLEGEEGESSYNRSGDRTEIGLPGAQEALIQAVHAAGKPVVLVLLSGSALAIEWAAEHVPAILAVWYGGEEAGTALAEVLWGDYNPAGRLPITFYRSLDQVPPFEDYRMEGRTYRFLREEPRYRFGHGLSYTQFAYSDLKIVPERLEPGESVTVQATVVNTGERAGDEVIQLYLRDVEASVPTPIRHLEGFQREHLQPGESRVVSFKLGPAQMVCWTDDGRSVIEPGIFEVSVGGGQPGEGVTYLSGSFEVIGAAQEV